MRYEFEMEDKMDTKADVNTTLKVVNQGMFGVYWRNLNADKWKNSLKMIYNVVNMLGLQLVETVVDYQLS